MKRTLFLTLVFAHLVGVGLGQAILLEDTDTLKHTIGTPIHQVRIYEIPKENRQVFHKRFKDHAHRIMIKYGFNIVAMWESEFEGKIEFVYLLEWTDENTMKTAWNNFMADQEWKDIKAETSRVHGTFVTKIQDRTLLLTNYSPLRVLIEGQRNGSIKQK